MKHKKNRDVLNNSFKNQIGIMTFLICIAFMVIGIISVNYYKNNLQSWIYKEAELTLENVSSQNVKSIQNEIQKKQKLLEYIASSIQKKSEFDIETILENINMFNDLYGFYNMGIIDKNGICYTTLGETLDLSGYDYFKKGMQGISEVSKSYKSEDDTTMLNIFTYPVYKAGKVEMLLILTYKSEDFYERINMTSFNGQGESIVINRESTLVTTFQENQNGEQETIDILELIKKDNYEYYYQMMNDMANFQKRTIEFKWQGAKYLAYYEPLGIDEWYLISMVPASVIYQNTSKIQKSINLGTGVIIVVFVAFLGVFIFNYMKYKKKIFNIVFIDELTQEKNLDYLNIDFNEMDFFNRKNKSLVLLDIDKFKAINMMYGNDKGDELLRHVMKSLKEELPDDKIYKGKADIFVAIISHKNKGELLNKIYTLIMRIKKDIDEQLMMPISISMGICSIDNTYSFNEIYNNALIAKTNVKGRTDSFFSFFDEASRSRMIKNTEIEAKFPEALQNEEFEVWYQPKYDMRGNTINAVEALIRWRNSEGVLLLPGKFIPVFEHNGQIIQLDKEVIRQVCRDMEEMISLGYEVVPVSINLSRLHLEHPGIIQTIQENIKKYNIDPSKLSFEITESALIDNKDALDSIVSKLHKLGVTVEMDDYGVGTSTISSLLSSRFDILKLDKSFIDNIGSQETEIVIQSTISMAQKLNMQVIAEGIEHKEQVDFLIANHCYFGQGFYFSKALSKDDYIALLPQQITK